MSSGVSASPSSLESRALSPAAFAQPLGDGSGTGVTAGGAAGGRGLEAEKEEDEEGPPGTLEKIHRIHRKTSEYSHICVSLIQKLAFCSTPWWLSMETQSFSSIAVQN